MTQHQDTQYNILSAKDIKKSDCYKIIKENTLLKLIK